MKYYIASYKQTYKSCNKYINVNHVKKLLEIEDNQEVLCYLKKYHHSKITKLKCIEITEQIELIKQNFDKVLGGDE